MEFNSEFICHPTVCAVEDEYQIITPVRNPMLFMVQVGDKTYYDHNEGVLRSDTKLHRVNVPRKELDAAGAYTVICRKVIDRKPYWPTFEDAFRVTYAFRPVPENCPCNVYMIADAHGMVDATSSAGRFFGNDLNLLILNGDIADSSESPEEIFTTYRIASNVTEGQIPVIITRGNHDNRGHCAEKLPDYMPNHNGHLYYSVKLGPIWAALLDCGEDKADDEGPYGGTICFTEFRDAEEAWLKKTAEEKNYLKSGHRWVISHVPFTYNNMDIERDHYAFNIEVERYTRWAKLLGETIRPEMMLCGHTHWLSVSMPGSEYDCKGQPCPVVIGSRPQKPDRFVGTAIRLHDDCAEILFTDQDRGIVEEHRLDFTR